MLKQCPYGASAGKPHLSAICFDEPVDRECAGSFRLGAMIYGLAVAASCGGRRCGEPMAQVYESVAAIY